MLKNKVKLLDPKIDAVFQILFSKTNPEVIKGLLSAILNIPISNITNNTIDLDLNKILDRSFPDDKIGVLDVRAQVNNEIEINLEMQMVYRDMLIERILWYWAKLYSSQLKSGDDYSELKKTLEVLIVNDNIPSFKDILKPYTKWEIREHEILSEILTDNFEIVIIELPKVEQAYLKNKDNLLLQWMMFLINPESLEVSEIMQENEEIKIATKELEEISESAANQRIAELREKARRDDAALLSTGKRLGREEAEKQLQQYIDELKEQSRKCIAELEKQNSDNKKELEQYIAELKEQSRKDISELEKQNSDNKKELEEKMSKVINNLFNLKIPIEKIAEITGLTAEEIENILNMK